VQRQPELEFLPAALEVERTPPLPLARWILRSIVALFVVSIAWASLGEVNIVASAHGKIVPSARVKVIQPVETAVVRAIKVSEGQAVEAGDPLVQLDDTQVRADLDRLSEERRRLGWDAARLHALLARLGWEHDDGANAASLAGVIRARTNKEFQVFAAQQLALRNELRQNRAERRGISARIERTNATLPLITERTDAIKHLALQSLAPRAVWLELEQQRVEQSKLIAIYAAELEQSDAGYAHIEQRLATLIAKTETDWRAQLADVDNRLASYTQEIRKATNRVAEYRLHAPIAGIVQQLMVTTIGGVVTPAEKLMLVVPSEGALHIEAWVPNKDIGFIENGQATVIKVETFPFTKYGTIDGVIESVSHDAVPNEQLGLVYLAQISMATTTMSVGAKRIKLSPGMAVSVDVNIGTRRIIEFLLSPLLRYRDEGMTER
jgi:hemolysin D